MTRVCRSVAHDLSLPPFGFSSDDLQSLGSLTSGARHVLALHLSIYLSIIINIHLTNIIINIIRTTSGMLAHA